VAGAQATPASDLYALGVVAYECLAGAPPFSGVPLEVALAHRERPLPPLPPSVPVEVAAFVMLLTAKDAAWRPASAAEVERRAAALRDALRAGGAAPASPAEASGGPSRAFRALPALAPDTRDDRRRPLLAPLPGTARAGRPALAVTCILLAALTGLVLASVLGFALPQHQASAPSVASSVPQAGHVRPEHRVGQARVVRPAPSARPASAPTSDEAVLRTAGPREQRSPHGHRPTKGPGKGPSKDRSKGTGGGPGKDPGKGPGKGSGEQGGAGGGDGPVGGQGSQALGA
jgi:serine/threonine-protein kinase